MNESESETTTPQQRSGMYSVTIYVESVPVPVSVPLHREMLFCVMVVFSRYE